MKLTVLFPAYFPSLLWWNKFLRADIVVFLDDYAFPTSAHLNRTYIKSVEGKVPLTVPVLHKGPEQAVRNVRVDETKNWRKTHQHSIETNYRNAPYFEHYFPHLQEFYGQVRSTFFEVAMDGFQLVTQLLRLEKESHFSSETRFTGSREERILKLLRKYNCSTYLIETDSEEYFDAEVIEREGYLVELVPPPTKPYQQQFEPFIPGLSILDVLLNEGPYAIPILRDEQV